MLKYYVYIMTNRWHTLYVGVTNNLERRVLEHKYKIKKGFAAKYNITELAYFERFDFIFHAIEREKQIKSWRRQKKVALIEEINPT